MFYRCVWVCMGVCRHVYRKSVGICRSRCVQVVGMKVYTQRCMCTEVCADMCKCVFYWGVCVRVQVCVYMEGVGMCRGICVQAVGRMWKSVCVHLGVNEQNCMQVCVCASIYVYRGINVCRCVCVYTWVCVYKVDMSICWSVCLGHRGYADVCPEIYVCGQGYAGIYV